MSFNAQMSTLRRYPEFQHVAESNWTYEESQIPPGALPPMPILERSDAGQAPVRLKARLIQDIKDSAVRACISRAAAAAVTAFCSQRNLNFMQQAINPYIQDLPFLLSDS